MSKKSLMLAFLVFLVFNFIVVAREIYVNDDGPADFNNIQAAINDANDGDEIVVADGTYTGDGNRDIDFLGKAIVVRSENGPTDCIIDCNAIESGLHRAFYFISDECRTSVLKGFTISRANRTDEWYRPSAIVFNISCPTILNCIFKENFGGAMHAAGECSDGAFPYIQNCTFYNNHGDDASVLFVSDDGEITLKNCIIWANSEPTFDYLVAGKCGGVTIRPEFSMLQSSWSQQTPNCIIADPCFADSDNGNLHLKSEYGRWDSSSQNWVRDDVTSLAIDFGDPSDDWTNELWPHGKRINAGAYGNTAEASMSSSTVGNIADFDCNDVVNEYDLYMFIDKWLEDGLLMRENLNGAGRVDFVDYTVFGENWGWEE